jgi:hypothetical protein
MTGCRSSTGRHIHSSDKYAEIVEGELQPNVDGQPAKIVKAGKTHHRIASSGLEKARLPP